MPFDAHKNLAISSVATAPSPATSGATLTLATGEGARMPAVPFNATVWPSSTLPTPVSAEIVRVTAMTGDAITAMTRAQEGTTARAIVVGDLFAATVTVKALTDVESGVNFPLITTPGDITMGVGGTALAHNMLTINGTAGAGYGAMLNFKSNNTTFGYIGRAAGVVGGVTNGLAIWATSADGVDIASTAAGVGNIRFRCGGGGIVGTIFPTGGFSWGTVATDPGANNLGVTGHTIYQGVGVQHHLKTDTVAGADSSSIWMAASGGPPDYARGSYIGVTGNQTADTGSIYVNTGAPLGAVFFVTGPTIRGVMHYSGGFSWGCNTDPGAGNILLSAVGGSVGQLFTHLHQGSIELGQTGTASANGMVFYNANGVVGSIIVHAASTAFNTTSDARLKQDRGIAADTDVLRRSVVHDFTWTMDGAKGRGVFAQEAIEVCPSAVSRGTDERDDEGRLKQPWGVDYSRYVPDLIVGWQQHDGQVEALTARIEALETALARRPAVDGPSLFAIVVDRLRGWLARLPPLLPVKA